jgi:hypothetical protein
MCLYRALGVVALIAVMLFFVAAGAPALLRLLTHPPQNEAHCGFLLMIAITSSVVELCCLLLVVSLLRGKRTK